MRNDLLSVDQVSRILGLHARTVRRYIREDRLKARKVGKEWRVLRGDLDALTGADSGGEGGAGGREPPRLQASAVVDVRVDGQEEADRLCNTMLAAVTAKGAEFGAVQYESIYIRDERRVRLMFWGDAAFIGGALMCVNRLSAARGTEGSP
jgi:excisionase family DNA binding protein